VDDSRVTKPPQVEDEEAEHRRWRLELERKQRHELKRAEVHVPDSWRAVSNPGELYPGQCFYRSFRFVSNLVAQLNREEGRQATDEVWIVHGEYRGWHRHGWVELPGDVVFDGVLQRFYTKSVYYEVMGARPWYKYSASAAFLILVNMPRLPNGNTLYGEWHVELRLPWADPDNPTVVDFKTASDLLVTSGLRPDLKARRKKKTR
jgi:hypothetical protein